MENNGNTLTRFSVKWNGGQLALIEAESGEAAIEKLLAERGYGYLRGGDLSACELPPVQAPCFPYTH